jgi:hypothetical protein
LFYAYLGHTAQPSSASELRCQPGHSLSRLVSCSTRAQAATTPQREQAVNRQAGWLHKSTVIYCQLRCCPPETLALSQRGSPPIKCRTSSKFQPCLQSAAAVLQVTKSDIYHILCVWKRATSCFFLLLAALIFLWFWFSYGVDFLSS